MECLEAKGNEAHQNVLMCCWVSFTRYIYFAGNGRILKVVFATNGTQTSPVFSEDIAVSVVVALYVYIPKTRLANAPILCIMTDISFVISLMTTTLSRIYNWR